MRSEIEAMLKLVGRWHSEDKRHGFFDSVALSSETPLKLFEELAYWNYSSWHLIEQFPATAMESMRANRNRCEVMDRIDGWFYLNRPYIAGSIVNTESFGSIVDRIVNHQIKLLHVTPSPDERILLNQTELLIDAAVQLDEDCRSGKRYCLGYSRFKVNLPLEDR